MTQALIGGEQVGARSGEETPVVNPATEEAFDAVPKGGPEDVDAAVAAAKEAFSEWSKKDPDERAQLMRAGIAKIQENAKEIAQLLVRAGQAVHRGDGELHHFLHGMNYADLASKIEGVRQPAFGARPGLRHGHQEADRRVPRSCPTTSADGNQGRTGTRRWQHDRGEAGQHHPARHAARRRADAGGRASSGVLNVIRARARRLARRWPPTLTSGSPSPRAAQTGRRMMEIAAPKFKRVSAELGGSDPVIVFPDADVDAAVRGINIGRFFNAGQACLAAKRVYVFDEIYDEFLEGLTKRVSRYELGDGMEKAEAEDKDGSPQRRQAP